MNKRALGIIVIIILCIIGGVVYLLTTDNSSDSGSRPPSANGSKQPEAKQPDTITSQTAPVGGTYTDYHDGIIAETKGTKLLFFYASWCPQCRALEADIKERGVPDGVTIIKVDYDNSQKLRQQYGVTLQTTVVRVDDNGNLVKKFVAYDDPSLPAITKELL
jgi:thiol-disulfide isomerase/thioredoxin